MIRLIQRKLIIPRGDTGTFSVPVLPKINLSSSVAVFTIFDPRTQQCIFQKEATVENQIITIRLEHEETVNRKAGQYYWDIRFWENPEYVGNIITNGTEVDSYYATYDMPVCEIRETGDSFLTVDNALLSPTQINLLSTSVTTAQHAAAQATSAVQAIENNPTVQALHQVMAMEDEFDGSLLNTNVLGNVEATAIVTKAYQENDFVFYNNRLYRITSNLVIGDTLIEGQNCVLTNLTTIFKDMYTLITTPKGVLTLRGS